MIITRAYEIRIYPSKKQVNMINKNIGCARVVYNTALNLKKTFWERYGERFNPIVSHMYEDFPYLKDADSQALAWSLQNLNTAFKNWFDRLKKGIKEGYPKFKRKEHKGSYKNSMMPKTINKLIRNNKIFIPKLGLVEFRTDYDFSKLNIKKIRNITIKRSNTIKYYCSICVDIDIPEYEHTGEVIGIDLGIKDLIIDSNGNKYSNPKYQVKAEKKIKHLQRLYSKKTKGSKNQEKARLRLAIAHEKLCNKRKDNLHKLTTKLIKENDVICIENLNVKSMTKNHSLTKVIQDASFGTLVNMLKYKAAWHNRQIIEVGRFYPSSKLCHCCGHKMNYMGLEVRHWICPQCNTVNDRDINAAINIKNEGLRILDNGTVRNTETGVNQDTPMPAENPTMDDKSSMTLKSSVSMKQELLYKDFIPNGEGPVL